MEKVKWTTIFFIKTAADKRSASEKKAGYQPQICASDLPRLPVYTGSAIHYPKNCKG
jgi:hypothetical protein